MVVVWGAHVAQQQVVFRAPVVVDTDARQVCLARLFCVGQWRDNPGVSAGVVSFARTVFFVEHEDPFVCVTALVTPA